MEQKPATQELSDLFYGLQITVKVLEGLIREYDSGTRTQDDYENRFHSQIWLLSDNLKKVKPLVESIIKDGYSKYGSSVSSDSTENVHITRSDSVVEGEQLQAQES